MNLPLFIAKRIYSDQGDKRNVSRPAIRIAIVGVAIGLMVMIVTVCVVLGFKHTIRDKVAGFGGHIQVSNLMKYNDIDPYTICADDSMMQVFRAQPGVRHVQRYTITQGLLKTDDDFLGVMFKGVGPEFDNTFLQQNIVAGEIPAFSDSTSRYQLLMSKMIADKLHLTIGDKVFAYFIGDENVKTRKYTVAGIYQTNMTRFDENLCFTDLYAANRLNGWDADHCTGVEATVENLDRLSVTADAFIDNVNRTDDGHGNQMVTQTIYETYPTIFTWLELLDINVWIILVLMVCVAGFTMISGLLIIILERTQMIGILKALGTQQDHPPYLSLVLRLHHRTRYALGQHPGHRHRTAATAHGLRVSRPAGLLCQRGAHGTEPPPDCPPRHRHTPRLRLRSDRTQLPRFTHPSCQIHAI